MLRFNNMSSLVKIHASLSSAFRISPELKRTLKSRLLAQFDLQNFNERRFDRFGVISADIDPRHLDRLRRAEGVESVSLDGVKLAAKQ
jgi:hypothetical protein